MDPLLQYGPSEYGGPGPLTIALVVIGILLGSWLFGAALAFLSKGSAQRPNDKDKSE
ncbi:hypothetical protein [Prochlorococcus sp. MIT 1300]|uniref:hypothetical protein n=1 Tax=Prochlorococcus sp. MIT 1300 TaxID=3096218 RepID=UPI002A74833A|nr:hypothetical protein [Prochlorococcus sp. MIT 1300]